MIIIVEGIDRVGKTTLCEMIEDKYCENINFKRFRDDTRYVHNHMNKAVNTEKINTLQNLIEAGLVDNIILDRYHITEFVYGGIERTYKNDAMFDIDRRLAEVGTADIKNEDSDEVDAGMMTDGKLLNDVVLIYVVPVDIKTSSLEHGHNLERHLKWYDDFYLESKIEHKIKVDYKTLGDALDFIDEILGLKDLEEPGDTEEPSEPSVSENEDVGDIEDL